MKSFIALCFLAAICAMQASANKPLDKFKHQVETSKRSVSLTIAKLGHTKHDLSISVNQNLNTLWSRSILDVKNIMNLALDEIRVRVDAAKAEGKDVEHCYITAQATLHSILGAAFSGFRTCEKNERSQLHQTFAPLNIAMATGRAYMPQLDSIFPECSQLHTPQMQTCITEKLKQINKSITAYQSEVNKLIVNAQNGVKDVNNAVSSCFIEPSSTARSATTDLRNAADTCIKK